MKHEELTNLLKQLSAEGLGPIPELFGKGVEVTILDEDGVKIDLDEIDPIKNAMKKDPLFGSW